MSYISKVDDQKKELMRALFRNLYLKEKNKYLDSECKQLADYVIENQVDLAEAKQNNIILKKELLDLKKVSENELEAMQRAREQIATMSLDLEDEKSCVFTSLSADKSVNENLQLKNEMIECLQQQLVKVRLNQAENFAVIRDLKKAVRDLENEKQLLSNSKPETISLLQEQIMEGKIRENNINQEFAAIKRMLENLKAEVQSHVESQGESSTKDFEGKIATVTKKGVLWERSSGKTKKLIEESEMNIEIMKDEVRKLKNKIPELQDQIEETTRKSLVKEKIRCDLQEELNSAKIKEKSDTSIISERQRQRKQLENAGVTKLSGIGDSKSEKKKNIFQLSEKFENLSRNQSFHSLSTLAEEESSVVRDLEEKVEYLENKISDLKCETVHTLDEPV